MRHKMSGVLVGLALLAIANVWPMAAHAQMSEELAAQLSENVDQRVIVIMKSQHPVAPIGSGEDMQRSAVIAAEQAP